MLIRWRGSYIIALVKTGIVSDYSYVRSFIYAIPCKNLAYVMYHIYLSDWLLEDLYRDHVI